MRNSALPIVLVLLALIPIVVWGYTAYGAVLSYNVAKPYAGRVLTLVLAGLTPGFAGGILVAAGAFLLGRKPLGARVVATIGLVLVSLTVVTFLAFEGPASGRELMLSGAAYILVHAGVIVWLWKSRRRPAA